MAAQNAAAMAMLERKASLQQQTGAAKVDAQNLEDQSDSARAPEAVPATREHEAAMTSDARSNEAEISDERPSPAAETVAPGHYGALKVEHAAGMESPQDAALERDEGRSASGAREAEQGEKEMADSARAQHDKTVRFREMMDESQSQGLARGDEGRD